MAKPIVTPPANNPVFEALFEAETAIGLLDTLLFACKHALLQQDSDIDARVAFLLDTAVQDRLDDARKAICRAMEGRRTEKADAPQE